MDFLSAIAQNLISPVSHFFILCAIGSIVFCASQFKKLGKAIWLAGIFWLLVSSQPLFSDWLLSPLESYASPIRHSDEQLKQTDSIVVLACYHFNYQERPIVDQWPPCSMQRLVLAFLLANQTQSTVYVTGGKFLPDEDLEYASVAKQFLVTLGLEESKIVAIPRGKRTIEELEALSVLKQSEQTVFISSATHMQRLDLYLQQIQFPFNYRLVPTDFQTAENPSFGLTMPSANSIARTEKAIYEYLALINASWLSSTRHSNSPISHSDSDE